jgi:hypothetical protein
MSYTSLNDIKTRVSSDVYNRAFDRNASGSDTEVDAFAQVCINDAESEIYMRIGAELPGLFTDNGATVDPAVVGHTVQVALWNGVKSNPSAGGEQDAPFLRAYKLAMDFFDRLLRDDRNRLRTSSGGRAQPRGNLDNAQDLSGVYNSPYSRAADRKDGSGF